MTLTDWYANICKKLLPISKHFAKIVTKAVFVLNFANYIDIDRLRVILWRICELGWGRGPNKKGGDRYQTSLREGWGMETRRVDPCTWLGSVGMYCGPPLSQTGLVPACTLVVGSPPPPPPFFIIVHVVLQLSLYFYFSPQDGSDGQST